MTKAGFVISQQLIERRCNAGEDEFHIYATIAKILQEMGELGSLCGSFDLIEFINNHDWAVGMDTDNFFQDIDGCEH
ncbi:hypothetical protein D3C81_2186570 [compost metagenome]